MDPSRILLAGGAFRVSPGDAGLALLRGVSGRVRCRTDGRTTAERERHSIRALLLSVFESGTDLWPAMVQRQEAPDFVVVPDTGRALAIEHTDAGSKEFQAFCTRVERSNDHERYPSGPNGPLVTGIAIDKEAVQNLSDAIRRKQVAKVWRNAPPNSERWLLLADLLGIASYDDDETTRDRLQRAYLTTRGSGWDADRVFLVRASGTVIAVEAQK